jgi:hypothetical protein
MKIPRPWLLLLLVSLFANLILVAIYVKLGREFDEYARQININGVERNNKIISN